MEKVKVDISQFDNPSATSIAQIKFGDEVNPLWSFETISLTRDDIEHILLGGCIYSHIAGGEYSLTIALNPSELS